MLNFILLGLLLAIIGMVLLGALLLLLVRFDVIELSDAPLWLSGKKIVNKSPAKVGTDDVLTLFSLASCNVLKVQDLVANNSVTMQVRDSLRGAVTNSDNKTISPSSVMCAGAIC